MEKNPWRYDMVPAGSAYSHRLHLPTLPKSCHPRSCHNKNFQACSQAVIQEKGLVYMQKAQECEFVAAWQALILKQAHQCASKRPASPHKFAQNGQKPTLRKLQTEMSAAALRWPCSDLTPGNQQTPDTVSECKRTALHSISGLFILCPVRSVTRDRFMPGTAWN